METVCTFLHLQGFCASLDDAHWFVQVFFYDFVVVLIAFLVGFLIPIQLVRNICGIIIGIGLIIPICVWIGLRIGVQRERARQEKLHPQRRPQGPQTESDFFDPLKLLRVWWEWKK